MQAPVANALSDRLKAVSTASISDALDERNLRECRLDPAIQGLGLNTRMAGPAHTVRWVYDPRGAQWQPTGYRMLTDYFRGVTEGSVVVVDGAKNGVQAQWGELLSEIAKQAGAVGVVVDGGVRDAEKLAAMPGWSCFARHRSPAQSLTRMRIHDAGVPLHLQGAHGLVVVDPGDWVVGDADGVLVLPAAEVEAITEAAEKIEKKDADMLAAIRAGMNPNEAFMRFRRG